MPTKLSLLRHRALLRQSYQCFYCELPTWDAEPEAFAKRHGISLAQAQWRMCTAEHLVARSEGGRDCTNNIVAACIVCNAARHKAKVPKDPDCHFIHVQARLAQGKWLPREVVKRLRCVGV